MRDRELVAAQRRALSRAASRSVYRSILGDVFGSGVGTEVECRVALSSTIYNVSVDLSDIDRGVYLRIALRMALHPSESMEYMATRLMAYCLEYTDGIEMTAGLSDGHEPAIVVRDLTGRITAWIEIGLPDADRLHRASKLAQRVAVYTHRDPAILLGQLEGRRIHRAEDVAVYSFAGSFINDLAARIERRIEVSLSVTERHVYLDVGGHALSTTIERHPLA
jgi:uncharacterized protein YaeQ